MDAVNRKFVILDSLERVRNHYLLELDIRTHELTELRAKIGGEVTPPEEVWTSIGFLAHKLAGTSATLGFQDVGDAASILDEMLPSGSELKAERSEIVKSIDELLSQMMAAQVTR